MANGEDRYAVDVVTGRDAATKVAATLNQRASEGWDFRFLHENRAGYLVLVFERT
jgi:hypothetical protein